MAVASSSSRRILENGPQRDEPEETSEQLTREAWDQKNLLTFDGGGIRGYWSLLALRKLMGLIAKCEERRQGQEAYHSFYPAQLLPNFTHLVAEEEQREIDRTNGDEGEKCKHLDREKRYLPCHYFDLIGGSSTGGLIAIMLGRLRMTVDDCLHEYETLGERVFGHPKRFRTVGVSKSVYSAKALEAVFQDVCARRGEATKKAMPLTFETTSRLCKVFVMTLKTEAHRRNSRPFLIRSYRCINRVPPAVPNVTKSRSIYEPTLKKKTSPTTAEEEVLSDINLGEAHDFQIWQVARAATAAHYYFKPIEIQTSSDSQTSLYFEDGGLKAINPTVYGVEEIIRRHGRHNIGTVVSVGTAPERASEDSNQFRIAREVRHDYNLMIDPEDAHRQVQRLSKANEPAHKFNYFRLNPLETDRKSLLKIQLDEWEPRRSKKNGKSGERTLKEIRDTFNRWFSSHEDVSEMFQDAAQELVDARHRRIGDPKQWECYAIATQYVCNVHDVNPCGRSLDHKFTGLQEFEDHLSKDHGLNGDAFEHAKKNAYMSRWDYKRRPGRA